jgi:TonB family protein
MTFVIRGNPEALRRSMAFGTSSCIHLAVLLWVVVMSSLVSGERSQSAYDMVIRPEESRLVWYGVREKLPEVKPSAAPAPDQPQRALRRFQQEIAVGPRELLKPPQLIRTPAPEMALAKPLPLPNVLAAQPLPRPVRAFTAPADPARKERPPTPLPEAPELKTEAKTPELNLHLEGTRPVRAFSAPADRARKDRAEAPLPAAPELKAEAKTRELNLHLEGTRPVRAFRAPADRARKPQSVAMLPEAPTIAIGGGPAAMPRIPRGFTPPESRRAGTGSAEAALPNAPMVGVGSASAPAPLIARGMLLPPNKPVSTARLPTLASPPAGAETGPTAGEVSGAAMAIIGLNPANTMKVPQPPGSHEAGFSAGPHPRVEGSDHTGSDAALLVPGVSARGGEKETAPTLVAALAPLTRERMAAMVNAPAMRAPKPAPDAGGSRQPNPPDPRLAGRLVYMVAIQMPNITSNSGSWLAWFAEHRPEPGEPAIAIRPPVPLRKVDPKYVQAAADEKVQGTVRLFAVIRKAGTVDSVEVLRGLDPRLDQSAREALLKWRFEPATRAGVPVDVDAVFDIPFRLTPLPAK